MVKRLRDDTWRGPTGTITPSKGRQNQGIRGLAESRADHRSRNLPELGGGERLLRQGPEQVHVQARLPRFDVDGLYWLSPIGRSPSLRDAPFSEPHRAPDIAHAALLARSALSATLWWYYAHNFGTPRAVNRGHRPRGCHCCGPHHRMHTLFLYKIFIKVTVILSGCIPPSRKKTTI